MRRCWRPPQDATATNFWRGLLHTDGKRLCVSDRDFVANLVTVEILLVFDLEGHSPSIIGLHRHGRNLRIDLLDRNGGAELLGNGAARFGARRPRDVGGERVLRLFTTNKPPGMRAGFEFLERPTLPLSAWKQFDPFAGSLGENYLPTPLFLASE